MLEQISRFVLIAALAIICYISVAKSSEDLETLKEEAKRHGLNPSEAMKVMNDKYLVPARDDTRDELYYMSRYYLIKMEDIPQEFHLEWARFGKSAPNRCNRDKFDIIKHGLKSADAEWYRTNNRWHQVPPPLLIQLVLLKTSEKHAANCMDEYMKQVNDELVRTNLGTVTIADVINLEAAHSCMKESITWAQLRRDLPDSKEYYDCVRNNPEIFKNAIVSTLKPEEYNMAVAKQLVDTAIKSCRLIVGNLRNIFEMVSYAAELYPGEIYGSSELNEIWVAFETCKEFVGRDNNDVVELIAKYRVDPTKTPKKSKIFKFLARRKDGRDTFGALRPLQWNPIKSSE